MDNSITKKLIKDVSSKIDAGGQVYVILDAAKKPDVAYKPYDFHAEWISLYKGKPEAVMSDVSPYLLNLSSYHKKNSGLIQWIFEECWGQGCAFFLSSKINLMKLQKHFQEFLSVIDEYGKPYEFRFYDPAVWRVYLPTCKQDELLLWYKYVDWYAVENETGEEILVYTKDEYLENKENRIYAHKKEIPPLIIWDEQVEAFEKAALKRFEDKMLVYVNKYFPKHIEILEESTIRAIIQYGCKCSEKYGLTSKRSVCLYLSLMLRLGSNFDKDVQIPWAEAILNDESILEQTERIDTLYDKAMSYLQQIAGKDGQYIKKALNKIKNQPNKTFASPFKISFEEYMLNELYTLFPEKYQELGKPILCDLIKKGIKSAKEYRITQEKGLMIYIDFMFILGSGFDKDPQLPWANQVLNDRTIVYETAKVDLLYEKAVGVFEKWLV